MLTPWSDGSHDSVLYSFAQYSPTAVTGYLIVAHHRMRCVISRPHTLDVYENKYGVSKTAAQFLDDRCADQESLIAARWKTHITNRKLSAKNSRQSLSGSVLSDFYPRELISFRLPTTVERRIVLPERVKVRSLIIIGLYSFPGGLDKFSEMLSEELFESDEYFGLADEDCPCFFVSVKLGAAICVEHAISFGR